MGSGYTLSTTILHYNIWKRRRSFLGLSECRGFIEVLYASIFTLMHADACICIATEDPLHGFHPSACMSVKMDGIPCMCIQMDADEFIWMTAPIILFAIHRCMGCT